MTQNLHPEARSWRHSTIDVVMRQERVTYVCTKGNIRNKWYTYVNAAVAKTTPAKISPSNVTYKLLRNATSMPSHHSQETLEMDVPYYTFRFETAPLLQKRREFFSIP